MLVGFEWGVVVALAVPCQDPPALVAAPDHELASPLGSGAQAFTIESAVLGQTRKIGIVLPRSFAETGAERRYPVVVALDGEENLAPYSASLDQLARFGLIPESILVAIENVDSYDGRVHDLTPPGLSVSGSSLEEGGDDFLDFIEKELLPAVDRRFRGAGPRTIVGHSSGGILATYAAATRDTYRCVVAIDAPMHLGENWLAEKLIARAGDDPPPLRYAYYSVRFDWQEGTWDSLAAAAPATWKLHQERLSLEGHETVGMLGAYLGLREVFADYSRLAAPAYPTTRILPHYASLADSYGAPLVPPRRTLRNVVEDLLMEGRGAAAREAFADLVAGYGAPSDRDDLLEQIADVEKRPPPAETVEGLLATPFPTPEEAREFVGEWVGDNWMHEDEPRNGAITLRIAVVDGRVVGETMYRDVPEEYGVEPWQYMKVTSEGLTWGFMNGMRPRGVIVNEGTLDGDTLAGSQRFGGVDVRRPDGSPPPAVYFEFRRVKP